MSALGVLAFSGWHVAAVPAEELAVSPPVVLTALAAELAAAGFAGVLRRDLEGTWPSARRCR